MICHFKPGAWHSLEFLLKSSSTGLYKTNTYPFDCGVDQCVHVSVDERCVQHEGRVWGRVRRVWIKSTRLRWVWHKRNRLESPVILLYFPGNIQKISSQWWTDKNYSYESTNERGVWYEIWYVRNNKQKKNTEKERNLCSFFPQDEILNLTFICYVCTWCFWKPNSRFSHSIYSAFLKTTIKKGLNKRDKTDLRRVWAQY